MDKEDILSTLGAIGLCIAIICFYFYSESLETTSSQDIKTEEKIEILYTGICAGDYGTAVVCGGIKNLSGEILDVTVYTNVYDDQGAQIQDQVSYINNLEPNKEAKFQGYSVPSNAHETKIIDVKYHIEKTKEKNELK